MADPTPAWSDWKDRKKAEMSDPSNEAHGTLRGYVNFGCRCTKCRKAMSTYRADLYRRTRERNSQ